MMDENRMRFGVGVLVVASLGIAVILTFFFGAYPNLFAGRYSLRVRFPSAPGVSAETPVLKNGVQIGRVTSIRLLNRLQDEGAEGVEIAMEIDDQYPLFGTDLPRVTSGSLITGAAQIEFVAAPPEKLLSLYDGVAGTPPNRLLEPEEIATANRPLKETETLITYGEVAKDPYEVFTMVGNLESDVRGTLLAIQQAGMSVQTAGETVEKLARQVEGIIAGEDGNGEIRKLSKQAQAVLQNFDAAIQDFRGIFGDQEVQDNFAKSIEQFPSVLQSAKQTFDSATERLDQFARIGNETERAMTAAREVAENLAGFTEPLRENGEEAFATLLQTLEDIETTMSQVRQFSEALNRGDGTLRRLIEDDELYWQVKRIADNIEGVTVKIGPIVDDVRVLSDKLARDPRQLGVKGALDRRPSGMGLK